PRARLPRLRGRRRRRRQGRDGRGVKVGLLTREYPPDVYGGAGVHVEYLAREVGRLEDVTVHCWGDERPGAVAHRAWDALAGSAPHLAALQAVPIDPGTDVLERHGIDPSAPIVVFVGRITRQKGLVHLLQAALDIDPDAQLVLCAGAPDTAEIGAEVAARVERLRTERGNVIWLDTMLPKREVIQILSHA